MNVQLSQRIAQLVDQLPPLPKSIVRLRMATADPFFRYARIVPILQGDPALCANLLRLVNSAYYGVNHQVEQISEAVRILGADALMNFVTVTFCEKVIKSEFASISNLDAYFVHSHQVSLGAALVAKRADRSRRRQDFCTTAGLLHDIGRLVIMLAQGKGTFELTGHSLTCLDEFIEDEKALTGMDHCMVGASICERWQFSKELQTAVSRHHSPLAPELCEDAVFIFIAHFVTYDQIADEMLVQVLPPSALAALGLKPSLLIAARRDFEKAWKKTRH